MARIRRQQVRRLGLSPSWRAAAIDVPHALCAQCQCGVLPTRARCSRVLEWIVRRCNGEAVPTLETPIGYVPDVAKGGLTTVGLDMDPAALAELVRVDKAAWTAEMSRHNEILKALGSRVPAGVFAQHERLSARVAGKA